MGVAEEGGARARGPALDIRLYRAYAHCPSPSVLGAPLFGAPDPFPLLRSDIWRPSVSVLCFGRTTTTAHLRNYRSQGSYVYRTLLADNPAKASLARTIREVVAA